MKKIIAYLTLLTVLLACLLIWLIVSEPGYVTFLKLPALCIIVGGFGGCVYCLRGVYLHASVHKNWDDEWQPWYYIRPILSLVCGGISYLFLRAGLLVLEAEKQSSSTDLGFLALAFIAGLNVDRFLEKIENISHATWGIKQSKTIQIRDANQIDHSGEETDGNKDL